jgi:hypothetical protein
MSEAAASSGWPVLTAALDRLPTADAGRLRRVLEKTTDPRLYREIANHVLASARLLDDPGFRTAMDDVRQNPPDWSGPERSLDEWRALIHDVGRSR